VTAPEGPFGEHRKESLDEIEPRAVRRGEVQMKPRMLQEPPVHRRGFMRREVVEHDVHVEIWVDVDVDVTQEANEVLSPMLRSAAREDFARRDIQGGEQVECAVAQVGVGAPFWRAEIHRQDRLRGFQRLDL